MDKKYVFTIIALILIILVGCQEEETKEEKQRKQQTLDSIATADTLEVLPFVGFATYRPGIYVYKFAERQYERVWDHAYERVINLSYKNAGFNAFFLTAWKYGKSGSLPYLNRVRLYTIDCEDLSVRRLQKLGNGLQVATRWEDSTLKVILNSVDTTFASYIDQKMYKFDYKARQLESLVQTYDLTKDGYPQFPADTLQTISNTGNYALKRIDGEDETNIYSLIVKGETTKYPILTTNHSLRNIHWTDDDSLLVFSTFGSVKKRGRREPDYTSNLIIYRLNSKEIIKKWDGAGYKNFRVRKNILAFDNDFDRNAYIILYDLRDYTTIDTINISRGCGIASIPEKP